MRFSIPPLTTEQLPVTNVSAVDLRAGVRTPGDVPLNVWAAQSTAIPVSVREPGPVQAESPVLPEWHGRRILFAVRLQNDKDRFSEWSNLEERTVVPPVQGPENLQPGTAPEGVRLKWTGNSGSWRVFRDGAQVAEVTKPEYLDTAVETGKSYQYQVQTVVPAGDGIAVSDLSPAKAVAYIDTFPPAAPQTLEVVAGTRAVELSWSRSVESDFKHYRVWRNGEIIAAVVELPAYTDATVSSGNKYKYAVSAVDAYGNESPQSQPVEISAP